MGPVSKPGTPKSRAKAQLPVTAKSSDLPPVTKVTSHNSGELPPKKLKSIPLMGDFTFSEWFLTGLSVSGIARVLNHVTKFEWETIGGIRTLWFRYDRPGRSIIHPIYTALKKFQSEGRNPAYLTDCLNSIGENLLAYFGFAPKYMQSEHDELLQVLIKELTLIEGVGPSGFRASSWDIQLEYFSGEDCTPLRLATPKPELLKGKIISSICLDSQTITVPTIEVATEILADRIPTKPGMCLRKSTTISPVANEAAKVFMYEHQDILKQLEGKRRAIEDPYADLITDVFRTSDLSSSRTTVTLQKLLSVCIGNGAAVDITRKPPTREFVILAYTLGFDVPDQWLVKEDPEPVKASVPNPVEPGSPFLLEVEKEFDVSNETSLLAIKMDSVTLLPLIYGKDRPPWRRIARLKRTVQNGAKPPSRRTWVEFTSGIVNQKKLSKAMTYSSSGRSRASGYRSRFNGPEYSYHDYMATHGLDCDCQDCCPEDVYLPGDSPSPNRGED
jgi:hypothetical protein